MSIRGVYHNGKICLDLPLDLPEGSALELEIRVVSPEEEDETWRALGRSRMEEEWNNREGKQPC